MSRIGNQPISISDSLKINIQGQNFSVTGPKGELKHILPNGIQVEKSENHLIVKRSNNNRDSKSLHGLTRSLLANMVNGVNTGFEKALEIQGVGYRAQIKGKKLLLNLGYSHPIEYDIPDYVDVSVADTTKITVKGIDKQQVGQIAATIRDFKRPEPYKGKGIRYVGEYILMKEGKTV